MKKFKLSYLYVLALLVVASACKKEDEVPRGEYAVGVIVINEGNFGDADGTVGFYDPATNESTQDVYEKVNDETVTGTFQSMFTYENKSYLLDQSGHKIVVVEAETFKYIATINEGLNVPRYMTIANGKGYVSNWGPYDANWQTPDSYVAIIDLVNFKVSNTIDTDNGVEGMITVDGKVYAAASGSNKIHVIDATKGEIVGGYETPDRPKQFVEDGNGRLWVLCSNNLVKIDVTNDRILNTFEIAGGAKAIAANGDGSNIYYLSAPWNEPAQIFKIKNNATSAPQEVFITGDNFYGLGINPEDEMIYVGRSNGADNGTIIRYNADGTELDNFASGRFPNGFEFRK
ncbi:MAG: hypothetical protein L3J06_00620 [Cyclobacteriaceae bacterium]|nr:hypothetical protein [Cyclobacteriaceae bacterium]